jgi:hypothetical protein
MSDQYAHWMLEQEARALLTRLARIRPFALHEAMVPAAALNTPAQSAVERYLALGRRELRQRVERYLAWLRGPGRGAAPDEVQRRFTFLRLRFNVVLSHFDVFAEVVTQRSEHENGVWLSGLDEVAADALRLDGAYYEPPPVMCYLARGHGAAIRRARTRLPGGGESPAGIIRIPRERMVGSGIASSLVHEVGHQAAALLDLVDLLRPVLMRRAQAAGELQPAWKMWERWISEIVADFWSVGRVGVTSTTGLIGVVSLPRAFVFRIDAEDPHPTPWLRVRLSAAMGAALYPDPQWARLSTLWSQLYPLNDDVAPAARGLIALVERTIPDFVRLLVDFRPPGLRGESLGQAMRPEGRAPARLRDMWRRSRGRFAALREVPPSLAFAVVGQARADGTLSPEGEGRLLADLLTWWALRSTLETTHFAATRSRAAAALAPMG